MFSVMYRSVTSYVPFAGSVSPDGLSKVTSVSSVSVAIDWAGGFDVPRHRGQIGNGDQHANQDNEDGQADHQPVGAGPRLGSNSQAMLFFLRHVRYCNLTAIFMPRAYSAESVTGVLDWDHDRAGGIDGDLTVGLHLGGDIVRYGEQRVDDLGLRARS